MSALPPLATTDDIVARLGRPLSATEAQRAPTLLADASSQVRRYCTKFLLQRNTNDTQTIYVHRNKLKLPGMPAWSVASVVAKGDAASGLPDIPVPWFRFDGIRDIRLDPGPRDLIMNLPEIWWEEQELYTTFDVTYDHGLTAVPDEVIMVVANAAIGVMTAPTQAAGLIGESIGPYSWRAERSGAGLTVSLTQADLAALSVYRDTQGTSTVVL